jgi:hypothetical protein
VTSIFGCRIAFKQWLATSPRIFAPVRHGKAVRLHWLWRELGALPPSLWPSAPSHGCYATRPFGVESRRVASINAFLRRLNPVEIDLTVPNALTTDSVRQLLASKDDSQHRQLRVTTSGKAFISDDVGTRNLSGILFRLETWEQGNGYCGSEAAQDDHWVKIVFKSLEQNWPTPSSSYIDYPPGP